MKEHEIRPRELFDAYLAVARQDIGIYFGDPTMFVEVACPACDSKTSSPAFTKHGMRYSICEDCESLFMSPRPTREAIDRYYRESASSKFWAQRFFPETAEARRVQIFRPRAEMIADLVQSIGVPAPRVIADVGAGYGIFLEELKQRGVFDEVVAIEPGADLAAACRKRGFRVIEQPVEGIRPDELRASVMTSFEVLEHLFAPLEFLESIRRLMAPGGIVVFTTLTASGWDIRTLWERSKSVSPPHHINLLTTEGLARLVERAGLKLIELSTPGKLDVDIVVNMLNDDPEMELPRFVQYVIRRRGPETWAALQKFLQENRLSSHVRVVARVA
jgi:2-polyprenyl-3-methyl-5-hydroxy-6-metoxy-1,4-benzoquinol methylase